MNKKYIGNPLGFYNDLQDQRREELQKFKQGGGWFSKEKRQKRQNKRKTNRQIRKACRGGNRPSCTKKADKHKSWGSKGWQN